MRNVRTITWIGFGLSVLAFVLIPFSLPGAIVAGVLGICVSYYAVTTSP